MIDIIDNIHLFVAVFLMMELAASPLYLFVRRRFDDSQENPFFNIEAWKGLLERLVLFLGLALEFPQILIVFGTLKIANRLRSEEVDDKAKNYFLIGNLLSLFFVFLTFAIYDALIQ